MDVDNEEVTDTAHSKEAREAHMYCTLVYHPFVAHARKSQYGWDGNVDNIPNYLHTISWMDGTNGQLKCITIPENLELEAKLK